MVFPFENVNLMKKRRERSQLVQEIFVRILLISEQLWRKWSTVFHQAKTTFRSRHWRCSTKKVVLKNLGKFTWKRQSLFLIQVDACNVIKKETLAQVFSCGFCEIFKNTFFKNTSWRLLHYILFLYGILPLDTMFALYKFMEQQGTEKGWLTQSQVLVPNQFFAGML